MFQSVEKKARASDNVCQNEKRREQIVEEQTKTNRIVHVLTNGRHFETIPKHLFWCNIFVAERDPSHDGYKIGEIVLPLTLKGEKGCEKFASNFNTANIAQRFPGFDSIAIHVGETSAYAKNLIDFKCRTDISEEDASMIIRLRRGKRTTSQSVNKYIKMEHFIFGFDELRIAAVLFGKPGKLDNRRIFTIQFENYDALRKEITLEVKINAFAIKGDPSYVAETAPSMIDAIPVFDYFFTDTREQSQMAESAAEYRSDEDADRFLSLMNEYHKNQTPTNAEMRNVLHSPLKVQLFHYQKQSVAWMLSREGAFHFYDEANDTTEKLRTMLSDHINKEIDLKMLGNECTAQLYYSKISGCLSWQKQPIKAIPSTGGILADEMGLAKTIQIVSLIALHRRSTVDEAIQTVDVDSKILLFECTCGILVPDNDDIVVTCVQCGKCQHIGCMGFEAPIQIGLASSYRCPHCIVKLTPRSAKSTLIVVPNSMLHQWQKEIENNIEPESLTVRVYSGSEKANNYVHPAVLVNYDIVLTTYEFLGKQIHHRDLAERTRLRHDKRYGALSCPLLHIEWWRVCLDEAQIIIDVNSTFSKIVRMLPAMNRWCITATPIMNSLQDLYGIVHFLRIPPIHDIDLWHSLIMQPFKMNNSEMAITVNLFGKIFWRTEMAHVEQHQLRPLPRHYEEIMERLEFSGIERYFYDQRAKYWSERFEEALCDLPAYENISTVNLTQLLLPLRTLCAICTHPQLDEEAFRASDTFVPGKLTLNVFELKDWLIKHALMNLQKAYNMQMIALNDVAALYLLKHQYENAAEQYAKAINLAENNENLLETEDVNLLHALVSIADVHEKLNARPFDAKTRADKLIANLMRPRTNDLAYTKNELASGENIKFVFEEDGCWSWWSRAIDYTKCDRNGTALLLKLYLELKDVVGVQELIVEPCSVRSLTDVMTMLEQKMDKNLLQIRTKRVEIFVKWRQMAVTDTIPSYFDLTWLECNHFLRRCRRFGMQPPTTPPSSSCPLCYFACELEQYESLLCCSFAAGKTNFQTTSNGNRMRSWTKSILNVLYDFVQKNKLPETILADAKRHIAQFYDFENEIRLLWKWYAQTNDRMLAIRSLVAEAIAKDGSFSSLKGVLCNRNAASAVNESTLKFNECVRDLKYLEGLNGNDVDEHMQNMTNSASLRINSEPILTNAFVKVEAVVRTLLSIKVSHPGDKAVVICNTEAMLAVFGAEFVHNGISYILYRASKRRPWIPFRSDNTQVMLMTLAVVSTDLNLIQAKHLFLVDPYMNLVREEEQAMRAIHRFAQRNEISIHKYYVAGTIEEKLVEMQRNGKMLSLVNGNMTLQHLLELMR